MKAKTPKAAKVEVQEPKRGRGRPPILTAQQFRTGYQAYFAYCDTRIKEIQVEEGAPPKPIPWPEAYTKEGLSVFLTKLLGKFVSRHEIADWRRGEGQAINEPDLSTAVKEAYEIIDSDCMRRINETKTPAGSIFYAKAALGYRDVQTVETSGPNGAPIKTENRTVLSFEDSPATGGIDPTK